MGLACNLRAKQPPGGKCLQITPSEEKVFKVPRRGQFAYTGVCNGNMVRKLHHNLIILLEDSFNRRSILNKFFLIIYNNT